MENKITLNNVIDESTLSSLVLTGDISKLNSSQKVQYYNGYCVRLGLDPMTLPFKYVKITGREVLYAGREAMQQLSMKHKVSHQIISREKDSDSGIYTVLCRAIVDGRSTESMGTVSIAGLKGNDLANAMMKCETKAKRRSTFDLLGLGMLDETEIETIKDAEKLDHVKPAFNVEAKKNIKVKQKEEVKQDIQDAVFEEEDTSFDFELDRFDFELESPELKELKVKLNHAKNIMKDNFYIIFSAYNFDTIEEIKSEEVAAEILNALRDYYKRNKNGK